jgi:DNA-directed RNA polymerase subunit RPC12/RpoP
MMKDLPREADKNNLYLYCPYCGHEQIVPKLTEKAKPIQCEACRRTVLAMLWSMTDWKG